MEKFSNNDLTEVPNNLGPDGEHATVNSPGLQSIGHQNHPSMQFKNKRQNQKKSAIKNYGEIASQLLPNNQFDPQASNTNQGNINPKVFKLQNKKGSIPLGSHSSQNSYRGTHSNYFQSQA